MNKQENVNRTTAEELIEKSEKKRKENREKFSESDLISSINSLLGRMDWNQLYKLLDQVNMFYVAGESIEVPKSTKVSVADLNAETANMFFSMKRILSLFDAVYELHYTKAVEDVQNLSDKAKANMFCYSYEQIQLSLEALRELMNSAVASGQKAMDMIDLLYEY